MPVALRVFETSEDIAADELMEAGQRFRKDDGLRVKTHVDREVGFAIWVGASHPANDLPVLNFAKVGFKAERLVVGIASKSGGRRNVICQHHRRRRAVLVLIPKGMK